MTLPSGISSKGDWRRVRLENLEKLWEQLGNGHNKLYEEYEPDKLKQCRYVKNDVYNLAEEVYVQYKTDLETVLDSFDIKEQDLKENKPHRLSFCKQFVNKLDCNARRDFVLEKGICFNCLGNNHSAKSQGWLRRLQRPLRGPLRRGNGERMALEDQLEILEVASKSSNLKGTFQKALKCRAASLLGIVKELAQRTTSDETRQLQAKVDRLQKEVSALHARVAELMARPEGTSEGPASMPAPSNLEDIIRNVVMEERAFTRACFAGIEDRLLPEKRLRPPLAAERAPERTPSAPGPSTAPAQREPKGKGKGKGKKTTPAAPTAQTVPQDLPREDPLLNSTTPSNQPWVKVVSRKRKGKKKVAPKPPAAKPAAVVEKRKKLPLPPKSAAVVVTLTPEAAERGETYESVLRRARANVDPT
ncbi:hypothetical protein HF086_017022 [Spodoptera exigua]|uniref:Uncharacterized protein n=1 Tax=Spodoptera exigua TaxID=7107 RepID=A0A922MI32_SPOEX|nr:hypothetical protein HF086_017022 [Spodoptera exigua]